MSSNMSSEYPEGFEKVQTISVGDRSYPLACLQQKGELERRLVVDNGCDDSGAVICSCWATAEQVQNCSRTARDASRSPDPGEKTLANARCACADAREKELVKLMKRPGGRESL